ncbi:RidA family protein [Amycolatopsis sp. NBRC 101858]|uniref:RidA family protein n=1 Tax=Amycolatopsis sp. NBRC 101858 TaxID=3032200 RepID=UPI002554A674|nr:Rid family hydrolase [Amycolatopsis sp. NBRC 101858]
MTIERQNPPGLHTPPGYHHVTVAVSSRTVYLAGQCPLAPDGAVPEGLLPQVDQVVANTAAALAFAGALPAEVVRTVIYVVTEDRSELSEVWDRLTGSEIGAAFSSASTLLGVAQLGYPGQRVELDVTAALD